MNFAIGSDGDLEILNGEVQLVTGQEEIRQFLIQKLKTIRGTWFLNLALGLPYFEEILIKRINPNTLASIFINEIVSTPGIKELNEFDLNYQAETRRLVVSFKALTLDDDEIEFTDVEVP